jgi:Holliday junction DNA helicase RuvB
MDDFARLTASDTQPGDVRDRALRPLSFADFRGQQKAISNLKVYVEAARRRGEPLDHLLLSGPPGLGKTTLSQIVARELGVNFKSTSAIWPRFSLILNPMMSCSLMKFTV